MTSRRPAMGRRRGPRVRSPTRAALPWRRVYTAAALAEIARRAVARLASEHRRQSSNAVVEAAVRRWTAGRRLCRREFRPQRGCGRCEVGHRDALGDVDGELPRSTRADSSASRWRRYGRTGRYRARRASSSDGAGIHTVVLTMTPPSRTRPASAVNCSGADGGQVEQHVDRLVDRGAHVAGGVVDDLVGSCASTLAWSAARRGDHVGACGLGQLHGVAAHRPPAPLMRIRCPLWRSACSKSACQAVRPTSGSAAASASGMSSGRRPGSPPAPARTRPWRRRRRRAGTRSPGHPPAGRPRHRRARRRCRRHPGRGCEAVQRHRALHPPGPDVGVDAVE